MAYLYGYNSGVLNFWYYTRIVWRLHASYQSSDSSLQKAKQMLELYSIQCRMHMFLTIAIKPAEMHSWFQLLGLRPEFDFKQLWHIFLLFLPVWISLPCIRSMLNGVLQFLLVFNQNFYLSMGNTIQNVTSGAKVQNILFFPINKKQLPVEQNQCKNYSSPLNIRFTVCWIQRYCCWQCYEDIQ